MATITWKGYTEYLEHTAETCLRLSEQRPDLFPSPLIDFIDKTTDANNFLIWGTTFYDVERDENNKNPKLEKALGLRDEVMQKYFGVQL